MTALARVSRPTETGAVGQFAEELRRFVRRRVPGPDADDVHQDILLRIHLGVGALRAQERLAPWVYRVARSAIVDHQRRRRPTLLGEEWADQEAPEDPRVDTRGLLAACLIPFLSQLSDDQAEALRLTDLGGLTQRAAAAQLGVPLPTLKARVRRGRLELREAFEACCELAIDGRGAVFEISPRCGCP